MRKQREVILKKIEEVNRNWEIDCELSFGACDDLASNFYNKVLDKLRGELIKTYDMDPKELYERELFGESNKMKAEGLPEELPFM
jgi:hypothetical protein